MNKISNESFLIFTINITMVGGYELHGASFVRDGVLSKLQMTYIYNIKINIKFQ